MTGLLIVEDDEMIGSALTDSMRAHGHHVSWARTGGQALCAAGPFDLVLLDLGLPDLDGVEVCRRLRLAHPATVIVMLTARGEEMDVVVGLEAGRGRAGTARWASYGPATGGSPRTGATG